MKSLWMAGAVCVLSLSACGPSGLTSAQRDEVIDIAGEAADAAITDAERIAELESRIAELESQVEELQARLDQ